tara:strand:- start:1069 stop:1347 length:279 start_codon:yes stop_codon:yes gene_type:complete
MIMSKFDFDFDIKDAFKGNKEDKLYYAMFRTKRYGTTLTEELQHLEGWEVKKVWDPIAQANMFNITQEGVDYVEGNELYVGTAPESPPTNVN